MGLHPIPRACRPLKGPLLVDQAYCIQKRMFMPNTALHLPLDDLAVTVRCRCGVHAVAPLIAGNAGGGNIVRLVTSTIATRLEVFCSALKRFCVSFAEPMH